MRTGGRNVEESFVFEQFKVKADDQERGVFEGGNLFKISGKELVKGGGGFTGELGAENPFAQAACGLEERILRTQVKIFIDRRAVNKGKKIRSAYAINKFCLTKGGAQRQQAGVATGQPFDDEADHSGFFRKDGNNFLTVFIV